MLKLLPVLHGLVTSSGTQVDKINPFNFTELSDDVFHDSLYQANVELITRHFKSLLYSNQIQAKRLYLDKDASFRGFRQT